MPFPLAIPLIGMGVSALGNWLGNRNAKKQEAKTVSTQTSTPTMSPEYLGLQNALMPAITKRLTSGGLPRGYEEQGVRGINRTYDLGKQSIENNLTSRGLGGSPVAGAAGTRLQTGRLGAITDFQQELPMVRRSMENDDMEMAMRMLALGRGNTSTGNTVSTEQGGGGTASNVVSGLASTLGWMMGNGLFKSGAGKVPKMPKPNTPGFEYF